jgi:hypothetical protein
MKRLVLKRDEISHNGKTLSYPVLGSIIKSCPSGLKMSNSLSGYDSTSSATADKANMVLIGLIIVLPAAN